MLTVTIALQAGNSSGPGETWAPGGAVTTTMVLPPVTGRPLASRLAMTPRTLQRRLAETGTAFSELVDEARLSIAQHCLADDRFTLGEISYLLGFNEPSTFHKAFRRWKGVPPGAWREATIECRAGPLRGERARAMKGACTPSPCSCG
jgi:AraC-like DNA-binding protein